MADQIRNNGKNGSKLFYSFVEMVLNQIFDNSFYHDSVVQHEWYKISSEEEKKKNQKKLAAKLKG